MHRLFAVLWLTILLAVPSLTVAAPLPVTVNLRVSDLPPGFHLYSSTIPTGAQLIASGGSHAFRMRLRDLVLAHLETFDDPAAHGITFIESDTLLYQSSGAAHADYMFAATTPIIAPSQRLTISEVGVEDLGRTQVVSQGGDHERFDDIVFHRGSYIFLMRAAGINGTFSAAQVVALARIVDTRIQQTH